MPTYKIEDLVKGITPENRHGEVDGRRPIGNEIRQDVAALTVFPSLTVKQSRGWRCRNETASPKPGSGAARHAPALMVFQTIRPLIYKANGARAGRLSMDQQANSGNRVARPAVQKPSARMF